MVYVSVCWGHGYSKGFVYGCLMLTGCAVMVCMVWLTVCDIVYCVGAMAV